eukprot:8647438-Alexandrium_andersonii.AAC.1
MSCARLSVPFITCHSSIACACKCSVAAARNHTERLRHHCMTFQVCMSATLELSVQASTTSEEAAKPGIRMAALSAN